MRIPACPHRFKKDNHHGTLDVGLRNLDDTGNRLHRGRCLGRMNCVRTLWAADGMCVKEGKENVMTSYKSDLWFGALTGNGRVLVVDDEPLVRNVVRMILEKAGYEVLEAEDGEKAIEAINSDENPLVLDVVICDIRMPKINGIAAIDYFQRQYPHVALIVLTGYPDTNMAVSFMRDRVDYLMKPVEAGRLIASVAEAMDRRNLARV
jgi:two-component system, chemotaxis family, chemotaxis protein CheY